MMSLWLQHKYMNLISHRLRNFKRKSSNLYNFSCPFCNDSLKNKHKARGYVYEKEGRLTYCCHNCNMPLLGMPGFLERLDLSLYEEYRMELFDERKTEKLEVYKTEKPTFDTSISILKGLKSVDKLDEDSEVRKFVLRRKIPESYHHKLFECNNFMSFVNGLIPEKFDKKALIYDECRLLIPFYQDGRIPMFIGRSLRNVKVSKYMAIALDEENHVYGLDTVDYTKTIYVFEGPIDSMFIENSIAVGGGHLLSVGKLQGNKVIVYDNEPRSPETVKKLDKAIDLGYPVVLLPETITQKDMNDMVLAGMKPDYLKFLLEKNTYSGLEAKLKLSKWRKI